MYHFIHHIYSVTHAKPCTHTRNRAHTHTHTYGTLHIHFLRPSKGSFHTLLPSTTPTLSPAQGWEKWGVGRRGEKEWEKERMRERMREKKKERARARETFLLSPFFLHLCKNVCFSASLRLSLYLSFSALPADTKSSSIQTISPFLLLSSSQTPPVDHDERL